MIKKNPFKAAIKNIVYVTLLLRNSKSMIKTLKGAISLETFKQHLIMSTEQRTPSEEILSQKVINRHKIANA